jgi:recombination protein RecA
MAKRKTGELSGDKFQETLDKLNKQYGVGTVLTLDSKSNLEYDVISTGSIGFDHIALGVGGFVKGKLYELMGWESSGKSTICGHAAAECQKKGGTVLYIDGEHAVDKYYFQQLGVDTGKMLIAQPSCGEEGFQIAVDMIQTSKIDLVIIDSDSSLIPKAVLDGDVGDSAIGKKARLNSSAYPKLKTMLDKYNVCGIVVSQYREKIGVMFGNPTTTQGGHALKFYSDVRIEVSKSLAKEGDVTYGNITKIKATKNKMSPPYKQIQFEIIYGLGIDKFTELMDLADELELGKKYGQTYTFDGVKYNLQEFKQRLMEECDFFDGVKQKVLSKLKEEPVSETEDETEDEQKDDNQLELFTES